VWQGNAIEAPRDAGAAGGESGPQIRLVCRLPRRATYRRPGVRIEPRALSPRPNALPHPRTCHPDRFSAPATAAGLPGTTPPVRAVRRITSNCGSMQLTETNGLVRLESAPVLAVSLEDGLHGRPDEGLAFVPCSPDGMRPLARALIVVSQVASADEMQHR